MNNIEWLAKIEKDPESLVNIMLYKNTNTEENYFRFVFQKDEMGYSSMVYFDCRGNNILKWYSASSPGHPRYEEFHTDKESVDVIWEVKNK